MATSLELKLLGQGKKPAPSSSRSATPSVSQPKGQVAQPIIVQVPKPPVAVVPPPQVDPPTFKPINYIPVGGTYPPPVTPAPEFHPQNFIPVSPDAPNPAKGFLADLAVATSAMAGQRIAGELAAADPQGNNQSPIDRGLPFEQVVLDLSTAALGTVGLPIDRPGFCLYYKRQGSNPQGRLNVNIGGVLSDFYPGCRLVAPFKRFDLSLGTNGAIAGNAVLVLEKRTDCRFIEPLASEIPGETFAPVNLLGSTAGPAWVANAINTQPSGSPANAFLVTGWKRIRVFLDGFTTGVLTTIDVIPWLKDTVSGLWFESGVGIISVPDSIATGYRYRVFEFDVNGAGSMALELRNSPDATITPKVIVQGLK